MSTLFICLAILCAGALAPFIVWGIVIIVCWLWAWFVMREIKKEDDKQQ
jgi:hypothetical protein